jgi:mRNA guanylyltransferase
LMWSTNERNRNIVYLIDRKNDYYYVPNLFFPHHLDKYKDGVFEKFHDQTILDGELVEDRVPGQKSIFKFLVFDCLVMDGSVLMHRPLDKRLAYFKAHILEPWRVWYKHVQRHDPAHATEILFEIEDKSTEFSYGLEKMFREVIPKVKQLHGNDGLIFTCKDSPYHPGTDPHILKWKPPEENTVDFLLHIDWQTFKPDPDDPDQTVQEDYLALPNDLSLYIFTGDRQGAANYDRVASLFVTPDDWETMKSLEKPLQNAIVECYQEEVAGVRKSSNLSENTIQPQTNGNSNGGSTRRWRFHRVRDDKLEANHVSTYNSVIDSIEDHVTEEDLLRQSEEIRSCWKARDAARRGKGGMSQQSLSQK